MSKELRKALIGLMQRSHADTLDLAGVADQVQWNQLAVANWQDKRQQANAMFQNSCQGNYSIDGEDDQMGNVFINAGLMADQETTKALVAALGDDDGATASSEAAAQASADGSSTDDALQSERDQWAKERAELERRLAQQNGGTHGTQSSGQGSGPIGLPKIPGVPAIPKLGLRQKIKPFLGSLLPLLAAAGIAIAAANWFAPENTDTRNEFTIEAQPYEPE